MPVFFRYASYVVFFWTHENDEPIHFHIAEGNPLPNSTKVWILSDGSFLLANNSSKIPERVLRRIFTTLMITSGSGSSSTVLPATIVRRKL